MWMIVSQEVQIHRPAIRRDGNTGRLKGACRWVRYVIMYRRRLVPPRPSPITPAYSDWRHSNIVMPAATVALIVGALLLPYGGFCLGTFRFLSDEQAIDAAGH